MSHLYLENKGCRKQPQKYQRNSIELTQSAQILKLVTSFAPR